MTSNLRIQLPMPHAGQRIVRSQARRFNFLCAGRRWRKTTLGVSLVIEDLLAGKLDLWTAPTFDQVRIAWSELKKSGVGTLQFNHTQMFAELPGTGGKVSFRSLDNPDNARGHTVTGHVFMDEAAFVDETAWYEVLRPMLIDSGAGAWFLFTPKGRNWVWKEYELSRDRADSMTWQAPTVGARIVRGELVRDPHPLENPDVPFSELREMFGTAPERMFRQEILAEFLESAGGVFSGVQQCVNGELATRPMPTPGQQYVCGVDLAKHMDYTVVCVLDVRNRRIVDFHRFNKADWNLQKARIATIAQFWNNALIVMDATGVGDPIFDDLSRFGLRVQGYVFTQRSKAELINHAVLQVEQRQIAIPKIAPLISELEAYEYERLPAGGLRMNAPGGFHDDCVIAFALSLWPLATIGSALGQDVIETFIIPPRERGFSGERVMSQRF